MILPWLLSLLEDSPQKGLARRGRGIRRGPGTKYERYIDVLRKHSQKTTKCWPTIYAYVYVSARVVRICGNVVKCTCMFAILTRRQFNLHISSEIASRWHNISQQEPRCGTPPNEATCPSCPPRQALPLDKGRRAVCRGVRKKSKTLTNYRINRTYFKQTCPQTNIFVYVVSGAWG